MSAYDEREGVFGEELMRYLERSILLQVIDNRWREHLYDMDYLREGIHLRGFAQIDPLVAYKNEGFGMFEELMHSIWEEFSKLIFHVEVEVDPSQAQRAFGPNGGNAPAALDYSGGTPDGQPSALQQVAPRLAPAPIEAVAGTALGNGGDRGGRDRGQGRARQHRSQRSLLVRLGQEVQEVPRRLRAPRTRGAACESPPSDPAIRRSSFGPSTSGIWMRSSRVLDPEVELHSMTGAAQGASRRRGSGRRGRRGGCSRRSSWRSCSRTRPSRAGAGRWR